MVPKWSREPATNALEQIARHHLAIHPSTPLTIAFHADGLFNKVYIITSPALEKEYVLRVTLPMDPVFKTASEVATIEAVRTFTSVPVPEILAFQASSDNDLGFEWILMERMPGVPLRTKWRKMSWNSKEKLVKAMAKFYADMFSNRFHAIGNLYLGAEHIRGPRHQSKISQDSGYESTGGKTRFRSPKRISTIPKKHDTIWESIAQWPALIWGVFKKFFGAQPSADEEMGTGTQSSNTLAKDSQATTALDISNIKTAHTGKIPHSASPRIGCVVSQAFFWRNNLQYDIPRGPFKNSYDWFDARLQILRKDLDQQTKAAEEDDDQEELGYIQSSKMVAQKLTRILPQIFPPGTSQEEPTVIVHPDLHASNILVNDNDEITGILDWECVPAVPLWRACQLPKLLCDTEREEKPDRSVYQPDDDSYDEEEEDRLDNEDVCDMYWDHLMEYECTQLRKTFLAEMANLSTEWIDLRKSESCALKNDFDDAVENCDEFFSRKAVDDWANAFLQGKPTRLDLD